MLDFFKKRRVTGHAPVLSEVRDRIVPVIKAKVEDSPDERTLELSALDSPVIRPFAADLIFMYAFDEPTTLVYLSHHVLRGLNLSEDELHSIALANLPNRVPPRGPRGASAPDDHRRRQLRSHPFTAQRVMGSARQLIARSADG